MNNIVWFPATAALRRLASLLGLGLLCGVAAGLATCFLWGAF